MTQPTTTNVNMAKAICEAHFIDEGFAPEQVVTWTGAVWPAFIPHATAALRTLLEPSEEMIEAGRMVDGTITAGDVFRSMILSALGEGDPV